MIGATIIGAIIMDEISEINSSFHVKYRTMGKVQVLFSRNSLQVLGKNVCVWVCVAEGGLDPSSWKFSQRIVYIFNLPGNVLIKL